jgi:MFS family permease
MTNSTAPSLTESSPDGRAASTPLFRNPGAGLTAVLAAAAISMVASLLSVGILTMPLKATEIDAASSTTLLAVANAFAGLVALLLNPVIGRISDRTPGRFGRRRPYIVLGAALLVLGAYIVLQASGVAMLALGWVVMTIGQIAGHPAHSRSCPTSSPPSAAAWSPV